MTKFTSRRIIGPSVRLAGSGVKADHKCKRSGGCHGYLQHPPSTHGVADWRASHRHTPFHPATRTTLGTRDPNLEAASLDGMTLRADDAFAGTAPPDGKGRPGVTAFHGAPGTWS